MSTPLDVPVLSGHLVRIEPLTRDHGPDLLDAIGSDRATYGWTAVPEGPEGVDAFITSMERRAATGEIIPFAQVRQADGRAVGCTSYLNIRQLPDQEAPYAVEIGHTWLGHAVQRSGINTEAKLLLIAFAFETWGVVRVDFKTDARNERSRAAIARLGAQFEGVLRNWQPSFAAGEEGAYRDTAMFSITNKEWPEVRERLTRLLQRAATP